MALFAPTIRWRRKANMSLVIGLTMAIAVAMITTDGLIVLYRRMRPRLVRMLQGP